MIKVILPLNKLPLMHFLQYKLKKRQKPVHIQHFNSEKKQKYVLFKSKRQVKHHLSVF